MAESALETVPEDLQGHSSVLASAKRLNKKPSEILLDISWHFAAMKGIKNEMKRGRPDLIHFCLLEACSIPLFFAKEFEVFVHTIDDKVLFLDHSVRLPKSYHRFAGLIEKLYSEGRIEQGGKNLLQIKEMSFEDLIKKIRPGKVIGLSSKGVQSSYEKLAVEADRDTCMVVGGFARGQFSENIRKHFDKMISVDKNPLEAHIIISRILYECEKRIII